jgi:SAM-dependent methyltransferase
MCPYRPKVTCLSPLGYLLGVEGAALLRGIREGSADREFVEARIAEIRSLLDEPALTLAEEVTAGSGTISTAEVYRSWAPHYDAPGNQMIDVEQPAVRRILDGLPVGTALDAACGTGRHTAHLHELGHDVIGVDSSPDMLAKARERLPDVAFHEADLHRLPLADDAVDTVVCALALTHVPDLAPVLAEFARVLRPGGDLVISDAHLLASYLRPTLAHRPGPDGRPSLLTEHHRPLSAYLTAALPLGFQVRHCEEPGRPRRSPTDTAPGRPLPTHMSWDLLRWCPEASAAALDDSPIVVVWHFRLDGEDRVKD